MKFTSAPVLIMLVFITPSLSTPMVIPIYFFRHGRTTRGDRLRGNEVSMKEQQHVRSNTGGLVGFTEWSSLSERGLWEARSLGVDVFGRTAIREDLRHIGFGVSNIASSQESMANFLHQSPDRSECLIHILNCLQDVSGTLQGMSNARLASLVVPSFLRNDPQLNWVFGHSMTEVVDYNKQEVSMYRRSWEFVRWAEYEVLNRNRQALVVAGHSNWLHGLMDQFMWRWRTPIEQVLRDSEIGYGTMLRFELHISGASVQVENIEVVHDPYGEIGGKIEAILNRQMTTVRDRSLQFSPSIGERMYVPRDNILLHAFNWFGSREGNEIRQRSFRITFIGEEGLDNGGLLREWYYLLSRSFFQNKFLAEADSGSRRYIPTGQSAFIGKVVAKAIRDKQTLPIRFAKIVLRYIIEGVRGLDEMEVTMDMLAEDFPVYAKSLKWILDNGDATQDLSFSVDTIDELGVRGVHDLKWRGSSIPVTEENKAEYAQLLIEYKLRASLRPHMDNFLDGFYSVLPHNLLCRKFTPDELDLIIAGPSIVDVSDLRANTEYSGYTGIENIQIQWFWEVVETFSQEELGMLIKFISGTPLPPVGGFAVFPLKISRVGLHENPARNPLPSAHTCWNQLHLPAYTSKEELRDKLILSMTIGSEGFGFS
jgi:hypothetical protein